jgi:hypothetical protein
LVTSSFSTADDESDVIQQRKKCPVMTENLKAKRTYPATFSCQKFHSSCTGNFSDTNNLDGIVNAFSEEKRQ